MSDSKFRGSRGQLRLQLANFSCGYKPFSKECHNLLNILKVGDWCYLNLAEGIYAVGRKMLLNSQSHPQSEFVALPLLWDTTARSAI